MATPTVIMAAKSPVAMNANRMFLHHFIRRGVSGVSDPPSAVTVSTLPSPMVDVDGIVVSMPSPKPSIAADLCTSFGNTSLIVKWEKVERFDPSTPASC